MHVRVAQDRHTSFPCLRTEESEDWVSLLPITKLQAEQWLFEGGLIPDNDPEAATLLIGRLELAEAQPQYPPSIRRLARVPLSSCTRETLLGILATNLSLWADPAEVEAQNVRFPTPESDWGRMLHWLGGRVPSSQEWKRALDCYAQVRSRDLLRAARASGFAYPPSVENALERLYDLLPDSERGLPFMNLGVYELVSETQSVNLIATSPARKLCRPYVAGESAIWPTLEDSNARPWRPVYQAILPVVTLRPWYRDADLALPANHLGKQSIVMLSECSGTATSSMTARREQAIPPRRRYIPMQGTMESRCPRCYKRIDYEVFRNRDVIWCYQENMRKDDGSDELIQRHSNQRPDRRLAIVQPESLHTRYLEVARKRPQQIRSVTVAGFTHAGKTTWLLSLAGLMHYPSGRAKFNNAFPTDWQFRRTFCTTQNLLQRSTINMQAEMENMWVVGDVPNRTPNLKRALHTPILFESHIPRRFSLRTKRQLLLVLNDIAGEATIDAEQLAGNDYFPHVACSTDVIFFAPAHEIEIQDRYLGAFANALSGTSFEGTMLDPKRINLILAIDQVDKLKHRSTEERELLNIVLQAPCRLPEQPDLFELRRYFATMHEVDRGLSTWLQQHVFDLVREAENFASVRYCGLSSFGFELVRTGNKSDNTYPVRDELNSEACLPFEPQPIRVVDPLFWLLHENGLVEF